MAARSRMLFTISLSLGREDSAVPVIASSSIARSYGRTMIRPNWAGTISLTLVRKVALYPVDHQNGGADVQLHLLGQPEDPPGGVQPDLGGVGDDQQHVHVLAGAAGQMLHPRLVVDDHVGVVVHHIVKVGP